MKLPPLALSDITDPAIREEIAILANNHVQNGKTITFLQSEQKNDKAELTKALEGTPWQGRSIVAETFRLNRSTKKSKRIDPAILLQHGVPMDVILAATVETESAPFWTISDPNEKRGKKSGNDDMEDD